MWPAMNGSKEHGPAPLDILTFFVHCLENITSGHLFILWGKSTMMGNPSLDLMRSWDPHLVFFTDEEHLEASRTFMLSCLRKYWAMPNGAKTATLMYKVCHSPNPYYLWTDNLGLELDPLDKGLVSEVGFLEDPLLPPLSSNRCEGTALS